MRRLPAAVRLACAVTALTAPAAPAAAANFAPLTSADLQTALTAAVSNGEDDVITLAAATYFTSDNGAGARFSFVSAQTDALTVEGQGAATVLDGNSARQVLYLLSQGSLTVRNLTLAHGHLDTDAPGVDEGAALYANATPGGSIAVVDVAVRDSTASGATGVRGGIVRLVTQTGATSVDGLSIASSTVDVGGGVIGGVFAMAGDGGSGPATVTDVTLTGNSSTSAGGVIGGLADFTASGDLAVANLTIDGGSVTSTGVGQVFGGVVYFLSRDGDVALANVTVTGTTATFDQDEAGADTFNGGVLYVLAAAPAPRSLTMDRLTVTDNVLTEAAIGSPFGAFVGAIGGDGGPATLTNSTIVGNAATSSGGTFISCGVAIRQFGSAETVIANNVIANNTLTLVGGEFVEGTLCAAGNVSLVHNTIYGNVLDAGAGESRGGGYVNGADGSTLNIFNNILWGNTADVGADVAQIGDGVTLDFHYNDFLDLATLGVTVQAATNNTLDDPLLVDPASGDFHLSSLSPVIDLGFAGAPDEPAFDFEGDPRVVGPAPDMGADEAFGELEPPVDPEPGPSPLEVGVPAVSWPGLVILGAILGALGFAMRRSMGG